MTIAYLSVPSIFDKDAFSVLCLLFEVMKFGLMFDLWSFCWTRVVFVQASNITGYRHVSCNRYVTSNISCNRYVTYMLHYRYVTSIMHFSCIHVAFMILTWHTHYAFIGSLNENDSTSNYIQREPAFTKPLFWNESKPVSFTITQREKLLDSDWLRDCEFICNLRANFVIRGKWQIASEKNL